MPKQSFTLTRTKPDGTTFTWSTEFATKRYAVRAAVMNLLAYGSTKTRREINAYGALLEDAEIGTDVPAPGGYAYRIDLA